MFGMKAVTTKLIDTMNPPVTMETRQLHLLAITLASTPEKKIPLHISPRVDIYSFLSSTDIIQMK
jgi:hypothetical protein